jgi:hypothetical protein
MPIAEPANHDPGQDEDKSAPAHAAPGQQPDREMQCAHQQDDKTKQIEG